MRELHPCVTVSVCYLMKKLKFVVFSLCSVIAHQQSVRWRRSPGNYRCPSQEPHTHLGPLGFAASTPNTPENNSLLRSSVASRVCCMVHTGWLYYQSGLGLILKLTISPAVMLKDANNANHGHIVSVVSVLA